MLASNAAGSVAAKRLTAEQRRDALLTAAIAEFGVRGFSLARTADIARRAGVSQPYVYALFPDKQALFGACFQRVAQRIRDRIAQAAQHTHEDADFAALADELNREMIESEPDQTLFHLRALTEPDPAVRAVVRATYMELVDDVSRLHGVETQHVLAYMARAVLYSISSVLDLPARYRLDRGHTHPGLADTP